MTQHLNTDLIDIEVVAGEERMTKRETNQEMIKGRKIKTQKERIRQTGAVLPKTILLRTKAFPKPLKVNHPQKMRLPRNPRTMKNLSRLSKKLTGKNMNANLKKTNDLKKKDNV